MYTLHYSQKFKKSYKKLKKSGKKQKYSRAKLYSGIYHSTIDKKGADRGIDVFASTDGLGLEDPRIFVEVKHRKGQMGSQDIRTFLGGRKAGDKCLYVSTGGFSKDAKYEAERSAIALTIIDIEDLANIISLHYDKFSVEGRSLLPLKKVYIPV